MSGWFLDSLEIEGFRGINNENDPLVLKFSKDAVNSISAPNGVGKSSIFDAITFALRREIPKLDKLAATESGAQYYVNRFHTKSSGTIKLTVAPETGPGKPIPITITRNPVGVRQVTAPAGVDGEQILASLDRDFVLLDHGTLQSFIDDKAIDRGRAFAGLLGLARYSDLRQKLQGLSNTVAFNKHFDTKNETARLTSLRTTLQTCLTEAATAFKLLSKSELSDQPDQAAAETAAHAALHQIGILTNHCVGKPFADIDVDTCLEIISQEEGGKDKARHAELVHAEAQLSALLAAGPAEGAYIALKGLSHQRDEALKHTAGSLLQTLYAASRDILATDEWDDKSKCPVCETVGPEPLLPKLLAKLTVFEVVEETTSKIQAEWIAQKWEDLQALEAKFVLEGEDPIFRVAAKRISANSLRADQVERLWTWRNVLMDRAEVALVAAKTEREALEKKLPKSMVAVTAAVEAARRLQKAWSDAIVTEGQITKLTAKLASVARLKKFLDEASASFAEAEAECSKRRLAAVEPLCQTLFTSIMHQQVKPALVKAENAEAISIKLDEFFTLKNVSAQALLSESFRNAFAVSVYLAAASLYGGAPKFVVLDDVTSSFDAGHQYHLMELIRTQFARPAKADGLQVIVLSHDTLLEKLFKRHAGAPGWKHQRLEGTARTAVLPQSDTINRVRDATEKALNAGQTEIAAPWLRRYLEHTLLEIIQKVRIPVPIDFALDDNTKQLKNCTDAIDAAVKLHQAAGSLVLNPAQVKSIETHMASIVGNFVAHEATGSTAAFSAASLLGVLKSIDDYADCFKTIDANGNRRYCTALNKV